jgi:trehalose transport system permease protein
MRKAPRHIWFWSITLLLGLLIVFPLYIMLKISLSAPADIFTENPPYWIEHFTSMHFRNVLASGEAFFAPLQKSLYTALGATVLSLLLAVPAAYGISRFDIRWRYAFLLLIFMSRMIPEVSIALPIAVTFIRWGLLDTTLALILAHLIRILPVSCFILVSVFGDFPQDIERQARIDG